MSRSIQCKLYTRYTHCSKYKCAFFVFDFFFLFFDVAVQSLNINEGRISVYFKIALKPMCTRVFCTYDVHVSKSGNLSSYDGSYRHWIDDIPRKILCIHSANVIACTCNWKPKLYRHTAVRFIHLLIVYTPKVVE